MADLPPDIGATLSKLRLMAGISQATVAPKVRVDQSRISRIENEEATPSLTEVRSYLEAVGTEEAQEYLRYLEKDWKILPRPAPDNPDNDAIWTAEQQLLRLDSFEQDENPPRPMRAEIEMHRQSLRRAAELLSQLDYQIAFVGDIGVGKTTALCLAGGLVLEDSGTALGKVILETGGGRTTLCEVRIKQGPEVGIVVEPHSETEIYKCVGELCAGLISSNRADNPETAEKGVSRELDRALRNMAGLARALRKTPDGKRIIDDPAAELAASLGNTEELRSEFASRLKLWKRTTRELWYDKSQHLPPLKWLRDIFVKINNGRLENVSLPRQIDILLPEPLFKNSNFDISFIDTRGVDGTAIRPDLKACLDDPRTLTVLCSSFNSAPDATMQRFIEHAIETGSERMVSERVELLVLPRTGEARAMKDDTGEGVDADLYGYELKRDQVDDALRRLGIESLQILFFNAALDDPTELSDQLVRGVKHIRQVQVDRIHAVSKTVDHLIENHKMEAAILARREVMSRLRIFIQQNEILSDRLRPAHEELVSAVQIAHARTVWATTRRQGSWYNLDVYLYLGVGAASEAKRRSQRVFTDLEALLNNMLGDGGLETAHTFLSEIGVNAKQWNESFLATVGRAGQETFRPALQDSGGLWSACEDRWGGGPGYRQDVAAMIRNWFEAPDREHLHKALEGKVKMAWQGEVLRPLRGLCTEAGGEVLVTSAAGEQS